MGRPKLTEEQKKLRKEYLLQKLEPYLMIGLSMSRALKETKIFSSEVYKYIAEDKFFGEKLERTKQYLTVLVTKALAHELFAIVERQHGNKLKGIPPQPLSNDDKTFLWKYALSFDLCGEEWGKRKKLVDYDPALDISKLKKILGTFV